MGYLLGQNVAILVTCVAIVTSTGFFEYDYEFIPFAVETAGPWSEEAKALLRELGRRLHDCGAAPLWVVPVQHISIAIQRGNAASAMGIFAPGYHVLNEKLAFKYRGQIPAFTSVYKLPVRHNRSDMYIRYTYLRVEFGKKLSKVDTDYDQAEQILIFKVQYTLLPIDIGVTGYALQVANFSQVWPHEKGMEEYT